MKKPSALAAAAVLLLAAVGACASPRAGAAEKPRAPSGACGMSAPLPFSPPPGTSPPPHIFGDCVPDPSVPPRVHGMAVGSNGAIYAPPGTFKVPWPVQPERAGEPR